MKELLSFSITLLPAGYVWWLGRRLLRHLDDPAFPELRFAQAQRTGLVIAVCLVASLAVSLSFGLLKVALVVLGVLVAHFPARKRIYGESWSLPAYLTHTLRFWLGVLGMWLFLALIPLLAVWAEPAALPVLALAAILVLLWSYYSTPILAWVAGATTLEDPALQPHFDEVLARARCARPQLLQLVPRGGYMVNAFALPSLRRSAVLFTADLLEALSPRETAAIFAHEVGHLEFFDRRRLLLRTVVMCVMLLGLVAFFLIAGSDRRLITIALWAWPVLVILLLARFVAGGQAREHQSDLRALELLGQPEPLISALTKIHDLMRLPRRWVAGREGNPSHPSLAHRLRAIREAAGLESDELFEAVAAQPESIQEVVVRGADAPTTVVALTADRLYWLQGVDPERDLSLPDLLNEAREYRSIRYGDLGDLRLDVGGLKRRYLKAVDGGGFTLKLAIAEADVQRVKQALETIDLAVRGTSPDASKQLVRSASRRRLSRLWGLLAAIIALLPPLSLPMTLSAILLALRPARVTLAAAGAIGVGAGVLGLRSVSLGAFAGTPLGLIALLQVALGGLILLELRSWHRQKITDPDGAVRPTLALLGLLAAIYVLTGLGALTASPFNMQLHLWARHQPGLTVTLIGLGSVLLVLHAGAASPTPMRTRTARALATLVFAVVAVAMVVGSGWFRDRWGDDPLAGEAPALPLQQVTLEKIRELPLEGRPFDLRLSPAGSRVAARVTPVEGGQLSALGGSFLVELDDGSLRPLHALDLAFLDEDHLAALFYTNSGQLELTLLQLGDSIDRMQGQPLPALVDPTLRVDQERESWEVAGTDLEEGRATLLSGDWSGAPIARVERAFSESEYAYFTDLKLNAGADGLAVSSEFAGPAFGSLTLALAGLSGYQSVTRLWTLAESETRRLAQTTLQVSCPEPAFGQTDYLCLGHDREGWTRVLALSASGGQSSVIAAVPGTYYADRLAPDGRLVMSGYTVPPLLFDPTSGRGWSLLLEGMASESESTSEASGLADWLAVLIGGTGTSQPLASGYYFYAVGSGVNALAAAIPDGQGSRVVVYRLPR